MAIASNMLVTKDGVPSPVLAKVAIDEPCHNGIYKNVHKSKWKKKNLTHFNGHCLWHVGDQGWGPKSCIR